MTGEPLPGGPEIIEHEALRYPSGPLAGAYERAGQFLRGWWGEPPSPPYAPEG
jgi:hypothetical protein